MQHTEVTINNFARLLVEKVKSTRKVIVIVGDILIDNWIHGRLEDCQDGCPKFVIHDEIEVPGGAANAARALSNWDVKISLYGSLPGKRAIKTRYVTGTNLVFRVDDEPDKEERRLIPEDLQIFESLKRAGAVLLSDYDKGFLDQSLITKIAGKCANLGIPCVADGKREPNVYNGCILKCNSDYQHKYNQELADKIYNTGTRAVVTYGDNNPIIWDNLAYPYGLGYDCQPVDCINHVGAGDCFAAHLVFALAYGFSLKEAAAIAHSAGRVYVQHPHNRPPYPHEIVDDMVTAMISVDTYRDVISTSTE